MISLWLPIIAAAIAVFMASSIIHMVLPYHRTDVRKLPGDQEDVLLEALQRVGAAPGDYAVPHAGGPSGMRDPAFIAKATKGPLAFVTLAPGSAPTMLAYGMALPQHSIWYRRSWATTFKSLFDSVIYGVVTGAAFAWLWPNVS